jgi:hypothetical protein
MTHSPATCMVFGALSRGSLGIMRPIFSLQILQQRLSSLSQEGPVTRKNLLPCYQSDALIGDCAAWVKPDLVLFCHFGKEKCRPRETRAGTLNFLRFWAENTA